MFFLVDTSLGRVCPAVASGVARLKRSVLLLVLAGAAGSGLQAQVAGGEVLSLAVPELEPVHARANQGEAVLARGMASWYGKRFHGRRTASGEVFDMNALTAAHRTLPFGTLVRVRSLSTGREVVVRINDRGPSRPSRVIDLSLGAARALGVQHRGVTRVELLRES
jgi:rare lipoprotein A